MVQTTYTQGTTAIDKTREADNKYQLNTIDGNKGWTLMSEMGRQVLFADDFQDLQPLAVAPFYIDVQTKHKPNVWVQGNTWQAINQNFRWEIDTNQTPHVAKVEIATAIAVVSTKENIVIKALFKTDLQNGGYFGGIVFRYDVSSLPNQNPCWRFRFRKNGSAKILELFEPGSTTSIPISFFPTLSTGFFELKVIIKNNFMSFFYNDLLLLTLFSTLNSSFITHGIISSTDDASKISCYFFKILNN